MSTTIGAGAINRITQFVADYTLIDKTNPANGNDTLTSMSFWCNTTVTGLKCGTFYGSGTSYTARDYEDVGSVTSGSKQTFTGLSCNVQVGDLIGAYYTGGAVDAVDSGSGILYNAGNTFSGTNSYTALNNWSCSMEGYGASAPVGIKWNGTTISKLNGVAVTKINGL